MDPITTSHGVGELIQVSLAPVFLLVAIGSFLNVVTQRLTRVIDRSRKLEEIAEGEGKSGANPRLRAELTSLSKRMTCAHWSTNFCAIAALLVAFTVAVLFATDLFHINASGLIAGLFALSMITLIAAICLFMVEIFIATRTIHVRSDLLKGD